MPAGGCSSCSRSGVEIDRLLRRPRLARSRRRPYRIEGAVLDKLARPLADAVVTILDGPLAGTTTRTKASGKFEFGVHSPGLTTLRASRDGFVSQTEALRVPPIPGAVVGTSFFLESLEPPIGLEPGTYTLAVTVDLATARDWKERPDTTCAGFPVALASRSYRAEIKEAPRPGSSTPTP